MNMYVYMYHICIYIMNSTGPGKCYGNVHNKNKNDF